MKSPAPLLLPLSLVTALPVWAEGTEGPGWQATGLVELEAAFADHAGFGGPGASDLTVATASLAVEAAVASDLTARLSALYEEGETPLELDEALLVWRGLEGVTVSAGQLYVPFGSFHTHLVNDPFTLELGEARESAAVVEYATGGFTVAAFLFNGDLDSGSDDRIDNGGLRLEYGVEESWSVGAGYLADLSDTDGVSGHLTDDAGLTAVDANVPAWGAHFTVNQGAVSVVGEYLGADRFDAAELAFEGKGAAPAAWNLELGYGFTLAGREATAAVGHQATREAVALGLPAQRTALGLAVNLREKTHLGVEYAHDADYDTSEGGTGQSRNTLTLQLAVDF